MPFAYTLTKADVHQFWRDFEARQVAKRATRESSMVQKSLQDIAWEAVSAQARTLVAEGKYRTYSEAVDGMKASSHPSYLVYMASFSGGSPPPTQTAPGDVTKVVKQAQDVRFAKRRAVEGELRKRVDRLLKSGAAPNEQEAARQVFKADVPFYYEHRDATYSTGPLPDGQPDAPRAAPDGPALVMAKRLALEMRRPENDPYGQYSGLGETEILMKVWTANPALYEQNRQESYSRG